MQAIPCLSFMLVLSFCTFPATFDKKSRVAFSICASKVCLIYAKCVYAASPATVGIVQKVIGHLVNILLLLEPTARKKRRFRGNPQNKKRATSGFFG